MLQRITSLPIWDVAVHTESRARLRFAVYANAVDDPQVQAAVMLNAWEESRHKEVLAKLVEAYGIPLASEPPFQQPRDPEWAYLITGYCECIDSFFAFGLFELARRSGFFPPNWWRHSSPSSRRNAATSCCLPIWWRGTAQICRGGDASTSSFASRRFGPSLPGSALCWRAAWTRKGDKARLDSSFTASTAGAVSPVEIDFRDLMTICLQENDRRFAGYDFATSAPDDGAGAGQVCALRHKAVGKEEGVLGRERVWARTPAMGGSRPSRYDIHMKHMLKGRDVRRRLSDSILLASPGADTPIHGVFAPTASNSRPPYGAQVLSRPVR